MAFLFQSSKDRDMKKMVETKFEEAISRQNKYQSNKDLLANFCSNSEKVAIEKLVNRIKQTIKDDDLSPKPKYHAMCLLRDVMQTRNKVLGNYVVKKILKRLSIFAKHRKESSDPDRGRNIFGQCKPEFERYASNFLSVLLECLDDWGTNWPKAADGPHIKFKEVRQELIMEKVTMPKKMGMMGEGGGLKPRTAAPQRSPRESQNQHRNSGSVPMPQDNLGPAPPLRESGVMDPDGNMRNNNRNKPPQKPATTAGATTKKQTKKPTVTKPNNASNPVSRAKSKLCGEILTFLEILNSNMLLLEEMIPEADPEFITEIVQSVQKQLAGGDELVAKIIEAGLPSAEAFLDRMTSDSKNLEDIKKDLRAVKSNPAKNKPVFVSKYTKRFKVRKDQVIKITNTLEGLIREQAAAPAAPEPESEKEASDRQSQKSEEQKPTRGNSFKPATTNTLKPPPAHSGNSFASQPSEEPKSVPSDSQISKPQKQNPIEKDDRESNSNRQFNSGQLAQLQSKVTERRPSEQSDSSRSKPSEISNPRQQQPNSKVTTVSAAVVGSTSIMKRNNNNNNKARDSESESDANNNTLSNVNNNNNFGLGLPPGFATNVQISKPKKADFSNFQSVNNIFNAQKRPSGQSNSQSSRSKGQQENNNNNEDPFGKFGSFANNNQPNSAQKNDFSKNNPFESEISDKKSRKNSESSESGFGAQFSSRNNNKLSQFSSNANINKTAMAAAAANSNRKNSNSNNDNAPVSNPYLSEQSNIVPNSNNNIFKKKPVDAFGEGTSDRNLAFPSNSKNDFAEFGQKPDTQRKMSGQQSSRRNTERDESNNNNPFDKSQSSQVSHTQRSQVSNPDNPFESAAKPSNTGPPVQRRPSKDTQRFQEILRQNGVNPRDNNNDSEDRRSQASNPFAEDKPASQLSDTFQKKQRNSKDLFSKNFQFDFNFQPSANVSRNENPFNNDDPINTNNITANNQSNHFDNKSVASKKSQKSNPFGTEQSDRKSNHSAAADDNRSQRSNPFKEDNNNNVNFNFNFPARQSNNPFEDDNSQGSKRSRGNSESSNPFATNGLALVKKQQLERQQKAEEESKRNPYDFDIPQRQKPFDIDDHTVTPPGATAAHMSQSFSRNFDANFANVVAGRLGQSQNIALGDASRTDRKNNNTNVPTHKNTDHSIPDFGQRQAQRQNQEEEDHEQQSQVVVVKPNSDNEFGRFMHSTSDKNIANNKNAKNNDPFDQNNFFFSQDGPKENDIKTPERNDRPQPGAEDMFGNFGLQAFNNNNNRTQQSQFDRGSRKSSIKFGGGTGDDWFNNMGSDKVVNNNNQEPQSDKQLYPDFDEFASKITNQQQLNSNKNIDLRQNNNNSETSSNNFFSSFRPPHLDEVGEKDINTSQGSLNQNKQFGEFGVNPYPEIKGVDMQSSSNDPYASDNKMLDSNNDPFNNFFGKQSGQDFFNSNKNVTPGAVVKPSQFGNNKTPKLPIQGVTPTPTPTPPPQKFDINDFNSINKIGIPWNPFKKANKQIPTTDTNGKAPNAPSIPSRELFLNGKNQMALSLYVDKLKKQVDQARSEYETHRQQFTDHTNSYLEVRQDYMNKTRRVEQLNKQKQIYLRMLTKMDDTANKFEKHIAAENSKIEHINKLKQAKSELLRKLYEINLARKSRRSNLTGSPTKSYGQGSRVSNLNKMMAFDQTAKELHNMIASTGNHSRASMMLSSRYYVPKY